MKYTVSVLFAFSLFVGGCKNSSAHLAAADRQVIEYQMDDDQYAIVIVRTDGMTEEDARELAMKKAAEKTKDEGKRYFTVEKEGEVQAMTSSGTAYDNPPPPRNMYYELIQSGNFGRDRFEDERGSQENLYPGYRVIFKMYAESPGGKAVDASSLVE